MTDPIRSWDDPRWDEATDPYRLIRSMTLAMVLQVFVAGIFLTIIVSAFVVLTLLAGTPK